MTRYLPIVFLVLAALGAGIAIVPGAWEMAFMKLRDKDFAAAERVFEDKFLAGDRSREVLLPLSELYVRNGRVDKSISVLTKYASAHPNDREVAARLAALLQEAQETPRAIDALEKLAAANPTAKALRELDRLHDIEQNTEGRISALSRLAKLGAASPQEALTLTNLLAATGQKIQALTVAYNALRHYGAKSPHGLVQVFSALAADANRRDLIDTEVLNWAKGQNTAAPLAAAVSALVDKNAGLSAIKIVEASAIFARKDPVAVVLAAQLHSTFGSKAKALSLYESLRVAGRLPATQDADYVALALGQKKTSMALSHVEQRGAGAFGDAILLYAIGQAALEGKTDWLKAFDSSLNETGGRPLPAARLALALGEPERAAALAHDAEAAGASVTLAQLYSDLGDLDAAGRVFDASVSDAAAVAIQDLPQATAVAIALKRSSISLALADRLVATDKGVEAAIQRTRALTLNGQADEALRILSQLNSATELADVAEIEALAAAKRFGELRTKLVGRLSKPGLVAAQRTNVIFLLNDLKIPLDREAAPLTAGLEADLGDKAMTGSARDARVTLLARIAPLKALPYLKEAAQADPDKQGYVYAKLLKDLGRAAELKSFLVTAARTAKAEKVRDDFLYELLKHGAGRDALPLLAERARADGAKWFFAYDEALSKHGTRAERLAALQAFADHPGTSRELKSQIAFQLLNLGDKPRAEVLFRSLAEKSGPKSPEVQQLAFLWGPRPDASARAWLKARAESAPPAERAEWAALLINTGDGANAEAVLASATDPKSVAALASVYAETRNVKALRTLIKSELPAADGELAKALAQAADALSLSADASLAYERAGLEAQAGRAAFFAGNHKRAVTLLSRAARDGAASFYLAEALYALNRRAEAAAHYRTAIGKLAHGNDAQKMRVVALARLRDFTAAESVIATLPRENDDGAETRNAYAGALMDQGETARAAAQLGY